VRQSGPAAGEPTWTVVAPVGYRIGSWEITAPLASGAWSSVYAARRWGPAGPEVPVEAALKILTTGTSTRRLVRHLEDMVAREAHRHVSLRHDRLVQTYEVLTVDDAAEPGLDGAAVLVMERARGSLADLLAEAPGRPLPDGERYLRQIVEGLHFMHAEGWVHGDLKPSNVLVREPGSCCLADFGLAGVLEGTHAYVPPLSTPDFTPPERRAAVTTAEGQQIRPSDDVWAFGVVAFLALTGRMPFPGGTSWERTTSVDGHVAGTQPLRLPDDLDPGWKEVIAGCLSPSPPERPSSAQLVDAVAGGSSGGLAGGDVRTRSRRPVRLRVSRRTGAAAGMFLLLGGAGVVRALQGDGQVPAPPAPAAAKVSASATTAVGSTPAVPSGRCLPMAKEVKDTITGVQWHRVWYCRSTAGAPQYSNADGTTMVGWMVTTTSWFLCYRRGARGQDGSDVWYYTQGDYTATGWEARKAWGYTPARYVQAVPVPFDGVPACPKGT
jgi:hypothetical protein